MDYINNYLSSLFMGGQNGGTTSNTATEPQQYQSPLLQATMQKNRGQEVDLFSQAQQMYPKLKSMDVGYKEAFGRGPGYLEYWPPQEEGDPRRKRPTEFPIDKPGVEVRSRATRPEDIMADVASHNMVYNDPTMKKIYGDFEKSLTDEQKGRLKEQYVHYITKEKGPDEKTPTYEEWYQRTGLPGWFRGYTFGQWPEEFTSKVYTNKQKKMLDKALEYLKSE
jgi:hypothetical protein